MKNTVKTLGISLALLTASVSANTALADSDNKIDLNCRLSFSETGTDIYWKKQDKSLVSSYKIYISDPVPQSECFKNDIPLKYVKDINKLDQDTCTFDFKDLENGKYYRFKLEAYNGSELVGSDTCGSVILGEDYDDSKYEHHYDFSIDRADLHTVNIGWNDVFDDNVKRTVKFYRLDDDGFHDFGSADLSSGEYTFKNLEPDKRYSIAAEIYEGEKMIFTYQFGFSTETAETETTGDIDALNDYVFESSAIKFSDTQAYVYANWKNYGASSPLPFKDLKYKVKLSEPLSSKDFFAGKKTSYKTYDFDNSYLSDFKYYYIPFDGNNFDQCKIYKKAETGMHYSLKVDDTPESSSFTVSGLKTDNYYRIKVEAYYKGELIASDQTYCINETLDMCEEMAFFDTEDDENLTTVRAASKDGKNVVLTWDNIPKKAAYPKGKRTVYFYLSSPYNDKKKIYGFRDVEISSKYFGKTAFNDLKYTLKDLKPQSHYMLYLEVRRDGKIVDLLEYELSTTINVPVIDLKVTKANRVELSSSVEVTKENLGFAFEKEYDIKFDNTCIKPEFVEYYRKDKNGKYKKIGTAAADKTLTDKNVTPGKTYTYKARAYSVIDGKKVYSGYSPALYNSVRIENPKPQLKISYANKKKKIIKITSDKNNGIIKFYSDEKICYSTNGKDFYYLSEERELKPGNTLYLKLPKKMKSVGFYYTSSIDEHYYTVKLNPNGSISKPKKDHF